MNIYTYMCMHFNIFYINIQNRLYNNVVYNQHNKVMYYIEFKFHTYYK